MKSLTTARGNPYVTMVWLAILGSCMLFLFLILLFFARTHLPGAEKIFVPTAFAFSTASIVLSSLSLELCRTALRKEEYRTAFYRLSLTLLLGISFALLQYAGLQRYLQLNLPLSNHGLAFAWIFCGLHFLHILAGSTALLWVWNAFRKNLRYVDAYVLQLNPMVNTVFRTGVIFWHFLGILWILLFLVLWLNQP